MVECSMDGRRRMRKSLMKMDSLEKTFLQPRVRTIHLPVTLDDEMQGKSLSMWTVTLLFYDDVEITSSTFAILYFMIT